MGFTLPNKELLKAINNNKLKSFSLKSLDILSKANVEKEKIQHVCPSITGKSTIEHKKVLLKNIRKTDSNAFKKNLNDYLSDCRQSKNQQEYLAIQKVLTEEIWQKWLLDNGNKAKINGLHNFWKLNQTTNHISSMAIQASARLILPIFEEYYKLARTELKYYQSQLADKVSFKLKNYLNILANEIKQEKITLCDAMLSRLKVASNEKDITCDDITVCIIKELNQINIPISINIKEPRHQLTPEIFNDFHHFILTQGSEKQQNKLKKLLWLKEDEHFSVFRVDNRPVIIPAAMRAYSMLDNTKNFFSWLFPEKKFRANFFKEKFYLLARMRQLNNNQPQGQLPIMDFINSDYWQRLNEHENSLIQEGKNAKAQMIPWITKLFYFSRNPFLQAWQGAMGKCLTNVLELKLGYALLLAQQLQTRLNFHLDKDVLRLPLLKQTVEEMIISIDKLFKERSVDNNLLKKWLSIKNIFSAFLEHDVERSNKQNLPQENDNISSTTNIRHSQNPFGILKKSPFIPLFQKEKILSTTGTPEEPNIASKLLLNNAQPTKIEDSGNTLTKLDVVSEITALYHSLLVNGEFNLKMNNFSIILNKIENLAEKDKNKVASASSFWQDFFISYLKTNLNRGVDIDKKLILPLTLIKKYAPSYLQERALSIEKCADTFIHETKCRALLFCFNETQADGKSTIPKM